MAAPAFPRASASLSFPGAAGAIETICTLPSADARAGVAIVCHPHPLQGGTMHNKVVTTLERAFVELGLATVRFNFRGVGASAGTYDEGRGEADDLAAIADWVRRERPGDALWLAGFSFGSYVVLRASARVAPDAVVLVAPPIGRWDFTAVVRPSGPTLVVQGEEDDVVDPQAVYDWVQAGQPAPALIRMPETGHFFHRRLIDLRGAVKNAVRGWLPPERSA
ncbi:MAG TPA: alpha/beta fold hydrolase [Dokdonella sp.]